MAAPIITGLAMPLIHGAATLPADALSSAQITPKPNDALGALGMKGGGIGGDWLFSFASGQNFSISISVGSGDRRIGHRVGLVQTLQSSERELTYEGGSAKFIAAGGHGTPCLDADHLHPEEHPWYRVPACSGKPLQPGATSTLTVWDSPDFSVPGQVYDGAHKPHALVGVSVTEKFVISLYDQDASPATDQLKSINLNDPAYLHGKDTPINAVIRQWTWGYSYKVSFAGGKPTIDSQQTAAAVPQQAVTQNIPLQGPVANDNPPTFVFADHTWSRFKD